VTSNSAAVRFSVARDVQFRRFHEEIVVLDLARGDYFSLDEVGARVWDGLSAGQDVHEIAAALAAEYDTDVARIEEDVEAFTHELIRRELISEARVT
jgi:hypothetical protein